MAEDFPDLDPRQESFSRAIRDPAGYVTRAQARAALRRSPAQLAVVALGFCLIGLVWSLLAFVLHRLHWFPQRATAGTRTVAAEYLMYLPALFSSFAPGLLLSNFVAHCIGPWGRVLDVEAARVPGTDYASSQRGLAKFGLIVFALTLPFEVVGVLLAR